MSTVCPGANDEAWVAITTRVVPSSWTSRFPKTEGTCSAEPAAAARGCAVHPSTGAAKHPPEHAPGAACGCGTGTTEPLACEYAADPPPWGAERRCPATSTATPAAPARTAAAATPAAARPHQPPRGGRPAGDRTEAGEPSGSRTGRR